MRRFWKANHKHLEIDYIWDMVRDRDDSWVADFSTWAIATEMGNTGQSLKSGFGVGGGVRKIMSVRYL